ncbi:MAG: hypothetical protein AAB417_02385 [Patescibacteria group bacterium]
MSAKLIRLDPERRDPNRTYGVPETHTRRVIPISERRQSALAKIAKAQTSNNRMLWVVIALLILLAVMISMTLYRVSNAPALVRPTRETPSIQTLRRHIRGVIFYIDKRVKNR